MLDLVTASSAELTALIAGCHAELVVNAAGVLWQHDPVGMTLANAELPVRLVAALERLPNRVRLVHLGSAYEYGSQPPDTRIDESTPEHPSTDYARSKLAGTRAIQRATRAGLIDGTVLRVTTALGPYAPAQSFLGAIAQRLVAGAHGPMTVPLAAVERDFIDVRDVADAVLAAATAPATGVFNVGYGRPTAPRELVDLLVCASKAPVLVVPAQAGAGARDAGVDRQHIAISAAREVLGWHPRRTLPDAVDALWAALVS